MTFYPTTGELPKQYNGGVFAAGHDSWNRANRAGYEVIRIPTHNGLAGGSYEGFLAASSPKMATSGAAS